MKCFVLIKQVPDTETRMKLSSDAKTLDTTNVKWVVNPYDEFAIEEAVKLKESNSAVQVFALSLGPKKRTVEALRTALAMGADEAIAVDAPENLEPLVTAQILAAQIQAEGGADLIFSGKLAIDDNASSVPQMVAEILGLGHASVVSKAQFGDRFVEVERDIEGGAKELIQLTRPCSLSANKGLNTPRYASLPGIMKAKKKTIKEVDSASLGIALRPMTEVVRLELPAEKVTRKVDQGSPQASITELVRLLRDEAKAL